MNQWGLVTKSDNESSRVRGDRVERGLKTSRARGEGREGTKNESSKITPEQINYAMPALLQSASEQIDTLEVGKDSEMEDVIEQTNEIY